ncbi:MAG: RNA polymerase sigma factor [Myxococcaceae bacterium]
MTQPKALALLLMEQQRRFLAFLTKRLGSQEAARDLLQSALAKALERAGSLRDDESVSAWFFRLLLNDLIDHYRHRNAERRALEGHAREVQLREADQRTLDRQICACVKGLTASVKPEYAAAVEAVDLRGEEVAAFAAGIGISPGNARVRLHRARAALAARLLEMCGTCCQQGCTNCPCEDPKAV